MTENPNGQDDETVFYYPGPWSVQPDGRLFIIASGYTSTEHWSGRQEIELDDADYQMWLWMTKHPKRFEMVASTDLDRVRNEFRLENPEHPTT
jgi:hypothetical protein